MNIVDTIKKPMYTAVAPQETLYIHGIRERRGGSEGGEGRGRERRGRGEGGEGREGEGRGGGGEGEGSLVRYVFECSCIVMVVHQLPQVCMYVCTYMIDDPKIHTYVSMYAHVYIFVYIYGNQSSHAPPSTH